MIHTYRKVEYISPNRELKDTKKFYGQIWEKKKHWITMVTEEVASRCGEFPKDFKIYDVGEDTSAPSQDLSGLIRRIEALEEYVASRKGGRPKKEE